MEQLQVGEGAHMGRRDRAPGDGGGSETGGTCQSRIPEGSERKSPTLCRQMPWKKSVSDLLKRCEEQKEMIKALGLPGEPEEGTDAHPLAGEDR